MTFSANSSSSSERLVHVNVTFRNTEATEALKRYAIEKVEHCLKKFIHQDSEVNVVLKVEKTRQIAEAIFHVDGADFTGVEESNDMYASIDALVDTLSMQLRKHKEKMTSHH